MILSDLRRREHLQSLARAIGDVPWSRRVRLMEVCGGHTAVIHRYALPALLPSTVELVSGPGCPVCVTEDAFVDACVELSRDPQFILATFGDLVRVPGSFSSLAEARAQGGDVRIFYSPSMALDWARVEPARTVVLAGIGFETTACTLAAVMHDAVSQGVTNLRLLSAMKTMPEALRALLSGDGADVDGLILPGHVMTVTGTRSFEFLARDLRISCAVSGFEPADLLASVLSLVKQIRDGLPRIDIQYTRSVRPEGNVQAQRMITEMFEPCSSVWRGLGEIPDSGLRLRPQFRAWDAATLVTKSSVNHDPVGCRCGEILRGQIKPAECTLFASACTPDTPRGACMVSSEGACAAVYQFAADE